MSKIAAGALREVRGKASSLPSVGWSEDLSDLQGATGPYDLSGVCRTDAYYKMWEKGLMKTWACSERKGMLKRKEKTGNWEVRDCHLVPSWLQNSAKEIYVYVSGWHFWIIPPQLFLIVFWYIACIVKWIFRLIMPLTDKIGMLLEANFASIEIKF